MATIRRTPFQGGLVFLAVAAALLPGLGAASAQHGPPAHGGAGPASGPQEAAEQGWILIPTDGVTRVFQPVTLHSLTLWYIDIVAPGAPFALEPQKQGIGACAMGKCAQTGDFDILFFRQGSTGLTSVIARYDGLGDERGVVPADATFALVFLKTPHVVMDDSRGWGFTYLQGDPGRDRLPEIGG